MFWILCVVIGVLAALLALCVVGIFLIMRSQADALSDVSRVVADHCSQFAYQLCVDPGDQVDLAKTLEGEESDSWRGRGRYLRINKYPTEMPMSSTEADID